ncbi:MAG TPA: hypothetical protein VLF20_03175 [Patescibacteria group bacterium]|nr:hypothetical protein [Patescibacteria group bacterium]
MLTPGFGQCKQPTQTSPCITRDAEGRCQEINTAFGVIKTSPEGFIEILFGVLLAASGAIAVLLLMRAGYQIMTARGNPEGIKEGREKIVAVILGLMFLVFSVVFLEVIGVDLLRIPGFSR